ncbi:MAG: hypothetical protein Q4C10_01115 [Clostridia bacterium]|nr:hypothetical protein [Clostridia bacterium]
MKTLWKLLAALACAVLLGSAGAEENLLLSTVDGDIVERMLSDGETLYAIGAKLYTWRPGNEALEVWEDAVELPKPEDKADSFMDGWRTAFDGATLFLNDGRLQGARFTTDEEGFPTAFQVFDVVLEDGAARAGNVRTLGVPEALEDANGLERIVDALAREGVLYLLAGWDGNLLVTVDSQAGSPHVEKLGDWAERRLLDTPSGVLLAESDFDQTRLFQVETDGSLELICELPISAKGFAALQSSEEVFASVEGRICPIDPASGTQGTAATALPVEPTRAALMDDGRLYAASVSEYVAVMDVSGELPEDDVLVVRGNPSMFDGIMLEFAVAHPEVKPVLIEDGVGGELLDQMLTRSTEADVYVLQTDFDSAFDALVDRGYALPLDSSEALSGLIGRMYPGVQRKLCRNGVPMALPLEVYGEGIGVGEALLDKLGFALEDVPDTWQGFLDFLQDDIRPRLGLLGEHDRFTYDGMTEGDFRWTLRNEILNDWVWCSEASGVVPDYGDPRLAALLERVEQMDLTDFGLEEDEEQDDGFFGGGYSWGGDTEYLVHMNTPCTLVSYDGVDGTPLLLGFGDDLPGTMALNLKVALISPYTRHPEAATELLELIADKLDPTVVYSLCPDMTEPLQRPDKDEIIGINEEEIARLQAELETAEPRDRQMLEETLAQWQQDLDAFMESGIWLIPEKKLNWYRAHDDRVIAQSPTWFERDGTGEAGELLRQYDAGLISTREFLASVDQKSRMQALEEGY